MYNFPLGDPGGSGLVLTASHPWHPHLGASGAPDRMLYIHGSGGLTRGDRAAESRLPLKGCADNLWPSGRPGMSLLGYFSRLLLGGK